MAVNRSADERVFADLESNDVTDVLVNKLLALWVDEVLSGKSVRPDWEKVLSMEVPDEKGPVTEGFLEEAQGFDMAGSSVMEVIAGEEKVKGQKRKRKADPAGDVKKRKLDQLEVGPGGRGQVFGGYRIFGLSRASAPNFLAVTLCDNCGVEKMEPLHEVGVPLSNSASLMVDHATQTQPSAPPPSSASHDDGGQISVQELVGSMTHFQSQSAQTGGDWRAPFVDYLQAHLITVLAKRVTDATKEIVKSSGSKQK
ncbi:MAG: hypothetical protein ACR2PX_23505 [Endozoicomonas sp.]|uniref:hypothetical protein n=1 Tax=Endozoicomonas sp. TaxID=1892382 RepID=UPI003D9ACE94